jgi:hypothetical protein
VGKAAIHVGDRVRVGKTTGIVVGVIERGEFAPPHSPNHWIGLGRGVLIATADRDLCHVQDTTSVVHRL